MVMALLIVETHAMRILSATAITVNRRTALLLRQQRDTYKTKSHSYLFLREDKILHVIYTVHWQRSVGH